jgi:four helix bundle protein
MKKAYTDLDVWLRSRSLAILIYALTKNFPKDELFGLTNQMRRAAVSVPSNIAEGCGRQHVNEAIQFFYIARGSLYELETQLYISFDQNFISEPELKNTLEEVTACKQLLHGFINYYRSLRESKSE